jgi:hypothetical protein
MSTGVAISQSTSGSKSVLSASHSCRGWWAPPIGSIADARELARDLEIAAYPSPRYCSPCGEDSRATQTMTEYVAILSAPPRDESPDLMVDMISRLIYS